MHAFSNLNSISKIVERLALACLFPHISASPTYLLQSALRKFHSTETALLKLTNDIMEAIALDLSVAFNDTHAFVYRYKLFYTCTSSRIDIILHPGGPKLDSEQWSSSQPIQV